MKAAGLASADCPNWKPPGFGVVAEAVCPVAPNWKGAAAGVAVVVTGAVFVEPNANTACCPAVVTAVLA